MALINVTSMELGSFENEIALLVDEISRKKRVEVYLKDWTYALSSSADKYSKSIAIRYPKSGKIPPRGKVSTRPETWRDATTTKREIHIFVSTVERQAGADELIAHEFAHAWHFLEYGYTATDLLQDSRIRGAVDICLHPWVFAKLSTWKVSPKMLHESFGRMSAKFGIIDKANIVGWLNVLLSTTNHDECMLLVDGMNSNKNIKDAARKIVELSKPAYDGKLEFNCTQNRLDRVEEIITRL